MNNKSFHKKTGRTLVSKGFVLIVSILLWASCADYLNVVPDNVITMESIFATKEQAYHALAEVYSYLPFEQRTAYSTWLLSDEYCGFEGDNSWYSAHVIKRGQQSKAWPQISWWSGNSTKGDGYSTPSLYAGIRQCNIFLQYVDNIANMGDVEKADWKGQVTFLKAYFHFLLLQEYGPIVISDQATAADAMGEDMFPKRSKINDCFDYIVRTMDAAIPVLKERAGANDLGMVDRVIATAIKARVLLFRASPFYTNKEYFGGFLDNDNQPFFPVNDDDETKKAKWKDAVDAADVAIQICLANGLELYRYDKPPYLYDRGFFETNGTGMQTYYDIRMSIVDPWNKELIWGASNIELSDAKEGEFAHSTNIILPNGYSGTTNNIINVHQELSASYAMLERYYTKNGLPVDEDLSFNYGERHNLIITPAVDSPEFDGYQGIMQPGAESLNLYMNREMRFYANMGITGGYWRSHEHLITTRFYAGTEGGFRTTFARNYNLYSGIGIQKWSHPETKSGSWTKAIRYPYPLMRMADLYLIKAEALNEYLDAPNDEVYAAINEVRSRAGIPDVETSWSSVHAKTANKHASKDGMREIILQERSIELAFEGSRYWDMVRHNKATSTFSAPTYGWSNKGATASTFFILLPLQVNVCTVTSLLFPIPEKETNINANLIQNPGW